MSSEIYANRIAGKRGQITGLTEPFKLDYERPFSLFIIPKNPETTAPVLVTCTTKLDNVAVATPFALGYWESPLLKEVSANGIDLDLYDVYWGSPV